MLIREDEVRAYLSVPLTREQVEWLARLVKATGDLPGDIIASMLEHIRVDDLAAHGEDGPHTKH